MKDIKVASRYAKSLLMIAVEQKELEVVFTDMQLISSTCQSSNDLVLLLKNPIIKGDKKRSILKDIFDDKTSKVTKAFFDIIVAKKREKLLFDISQAFIQQYNIHNSIKTVNVITAVPLTEKQKEQIQKLVKTEKDKSVLIKDTIDESIIGGIIVRVGDKQIDESIKRKLLRLEKEFNHNSYIKEV